MSSCRLRLQLQSTIDNLTPLRHGCAVPPPLKIRFADCQGRLSPSVLAFARTAPSSEGANEALRYYTGRRCVETNVVSGTPAPPRVALSESNVVSEDNRDTKGGISKGGTPLGTSLPPFFVKRKEGPCRGLSDHLHIVSKADLWAIVLFFVATLRKRLS